MGSSATAGEPRTRTLRLDDGRHLAYEDGAGEDGGAHQGRPVFLFHGLPGSRLQRPARRAALLARAGVRLITVDRPGIGLSDPQPGRRLLDWPRDVRALADALGLDRFRVVGVSGGGPYALACAYALPERVLSAATVGGLAPLAAGGQRLQLERFGAWFFGGLERAPRVLWLAVAALTFVFRRTSLPSQLLLDSRCARDRALLRRAGVRDLLCRDFREATRQGIAAVLDDARVLAAPWGFDPRCLRVRVDVWHGTADTVVRPVMGEYLARTIPGARRRFVHDGGHFSVGLDQVAQILEGLLEPARRARAASLC